MPDNVEDLQREITATRERLRGKFHDLTSDASISELEDTMRAQAQKVADNVVSKARETTGNALSDVIETVKERAAANPLAVLAIGAGLGWKLWKDPPVASALVGLGVAGLFINNKLGKQATEAITEKLSDASESITRHLDEAGDLAGRKATELRERGQETWRDAAALARDGAREIQAIDITGRNAALLGVAGLAVAAAVGVAFRRSGED